ncbi:MAG: AbrB/MazE/SpoVT family DNA-binding domain-containing protein [Candidatus Magasanikbacteria bacterium]
MEQVKISSKYQMVIPKQIREKLNIEKGDTVLVKKMDDGVYITNQPNSWSEYGKGLGKQVWEDVDPINYVREQRESWG